MGSGIVGVRRVGGCACKGWWGLGGKNWWRSVAEMVGVVAVGALTWADLYIFNKK